jgi:hypothetical protein
MRSERGWYWLGAGVLALGLNGAYQDGQLSFVHRVADRASEMVARASDRGTQFVTMAEVMLGRTPVDYGKAEAAVQRIQSKVVCERVARAQREMAMAHVREQIAAARVQQRIALAQVKMDRVRTISIDRANRFRDCARFSGIRVSVPDLPKVNLSHMPDVQMPDLSDLPVGSMEGSHKPI